MTGDNVLLSAEVRQARNTGNPCVVRYGDRYLLYFSAGIVFLSDLGFCEPRFIGVAESSSIAGPYTKRKEPVVVPEDSDPYRNRGAGTMTVTTCPL